MLSIHLLKMKFTWLLETEVKGTTQYCQPTFIHLREILVKFARISSPQLFLSVNQFINVSFICLKLSLSWKLVASQDNLSLLNCQTKLSQIKVSLQLLVSSFDWIWFTKCLVIRLLWNKIQDFHVLNLSADNDLMKYKTYLTSSDKTFEKSQPHRYAANTVLSNLSFLFGSKFLSFSENGKYDTWIMVTTSIKIKPDYIIQAPRKVSCTLVASL